MTPAEPPPPVLTPPAGVSTARRRLFNALGITSFVVGSIGIALPLLPTVPFYILAAFLFGKGNPAFERRLLDHPHFGPHIRAWRERGAISRRGKIAAIVMLAGSGVMGLIFLPAPWAYVPAGVALLSGTWIATRP
ncbi:YbaN family protein [Sphingomonas solaris]|uniref:DUF454 domain-containing protein n=1 Tax=Alterirhizorhabdus solaris TaxID=2529389 RepID=A0A558RCZ4_9SPHN|nr:YbaN family protein [Sphingomonas solaris]TVV77228.1 DUF454 domain-containing protein [Sphingomonas solaris]